MKLKKSIVILTSFWDANALLDFKYLFFEFGNSGEVAKLNFLSDDKGKPLNYSVNSVALKHPDFTSNKLFNLKKAFSGRLDFFCPTYDLLFRYKEDKNWDSYTKDYKDLLRGRKEPIREWLNNLDTEHIYILCCWENTVGKSHCHRELMYDAFKKSKLAKSKVFPIYRHGNKILNNMSKPDYEEFVKKVNNDQVETGLPTFQTRSANGNVYVGVNISNNEMMDDLLNVYGINIE